MNKNIKIVDLLKLLPDSQRIILSTLNYNGDTISLEGIAHVGDFKRKYSTYLQKHVLFLEIGGSILRIFI